MANLHKGQPISWAPSQHWDGNDGQWSSFDLRVGTPEQTVRVLPSTAGSATWVILPEGCEPITPLCNEARGSIFNQSHSSTWSDLGPFTLALEQNLGHDESGAFGLDTLSLGLANATGGPTLDSQIIAGIASERWYTGTFGLQQQPMNLTDFSQPQASFLSTLRARNIIPSLSWSYTAGAVYQSKGSFGSLTFGGFDATRYVPNNISFSLAPDVARDLVVGIQSITTTFNNGSVSSLLPTPTLAFIDSTVPYIYLPEDACKTFETELGLIWNQKNNLYFLDDRLHRELSNLQPQFTFRLGNDKTLGATVNISLPYSSFDLVAKPPLRPNTTSYFPLRRGNSSQITLGRAFLQEAYIIADYDQGNFTVAQAVHNDTAKPRLVPIPWNATTSLSADHHPDREATIGVSVGLTIFLLLTASLLVYLFVRRRKRRILNENAEPAATPVEASEARAFSFLHTQEMGHQSVQELHNNPHHIELLDRQVPSGSGNDINELPGLENSSRHELYVPSTRDSYTSTSHGERKPLSYNISNLAQMALLRRDMSTNPSAGGGSLSFPVRKSSLHPVVISGISSNTKSNLSSYTRTELASATPQSSLTASRSDNKSATNIIKALPNVPLSKYNPGNRRLPSRTLETAHTLANLRSPPVPMSMLTHQSATSDIGAMQSPAMSQVSTYAAIFDIDEYISSPVLSPKDSRGI